MLQPRKKYRIIIYLLSFIYANFFFLSPFFHHHHSDPDISQEQSNIVHSHLFNENPHSEESDSHFEDENHHSHFSQNNYIISFTKYRDIQPSEIIIFYSNLEYSKIDLEISALNKLPLDCFSESQWDKYVHTATNVSPPLS